MQATAERKECPITRDEFRQHAKPIQVHVGDQVLTANVKEFDSGSMGWNITGKIDAVINGKRCRVQVGANLTIVHSKEVPK